MVRVEGRARGCDGVKDCRTRAAAPPVAARRRPSGTAARLASARCLSGLRQADRRSVTLPADAHGTERRGTLQGPQSRPVGQHCSQINQTAIAYGWATTEPAERLNALVEPKLRAQPSARPRERALNAVPCHSRLQGRKRHGAASSPARFPCSRSLTLAPTDEMRGAHGEELEEPMELRFCGAACCSDEDEA